MMWITIVYRSAFLHKGHWFPRLAYKLDDTPFILEGDWRCPYNTRDEALEHVQDLVAFVQKQYGEQKAPPLSHN